MRFEKSVSIRGLTAKIIKESNRTPYLLVFDVQAHRNKYLPESLLLSGWEQDPTNPELWVKKPVNVSILQMLREGEALLGALYQQNLLEIDRHRHKPPRHKSKSREEDEAEFFEDEHPQPLLLALADEHPTVEIINVTSPVVEEVEVEITPAIVEVIVEVVPPIVEPIVAPPRKITPYIPRRPDREPVPPPAKELTRAEKDRLDKLRPL